MTLEDGPDVYGYTIFCDDIRFEQLGKLTYVGVYTNGLVIHGPFPTLLPKFAFDVVYLQRHRVFIPPKRLMIVLPGETEENPSITMELPEDMVRAAQQKAAANSLDPSNTFARLGGPAIFLNFAIKEPGSIKVRAERDGKLIRLGSLPVTQDPNFKPKKEAAG